MSTKRDYEQKLQEKLEECKRQISRLEEYADKTDPELREECHQIIDELARLEKTGKGCLQNLRQVDEASLDRYDPSIYTSLAKAVDKSMEWLASQFKHFRERE